MKYMDEETHDRLWTMVLAKVDEITKELGPANRGSNRTQAYTSGDGGSVMSIFEVHLDDGTTLVHQITAHTWPDPSKPEVKVRQSWHSSEDYWEKQIARSEGSVVVNGIHYRLGDDKSNDARHLKGFAGRRFEIQFHDGRHVVTNDLWYQGPIPPKFRAHLPDNAVFL